MIIFLSRKSIGGCWACSAEAALGDHSWGYQLYDDDHDDNGEDGEESDGDDGDNDDGAGAVQRQGVQLVAGVDQSRGRQVVPPCVCQVQLALARVRFPNPLAPGSDGKIVLHLLSIEFLGSFWDGMWSFGMDPKLRPSLTPTVHPSQFFWHIKPSVPEWKSFTWFC